MVYSLIQVEYMESKVHNAVDSIVFHGLAVESAAENRSMQPRE
ncbi:hypothetical protein [Variovorax sp. RKNM96]|nr:hypothetical protein [Variovorax sp. RKNM96]